LSASPNAINRIEIQKHQFPTYTQYFSRSKLTYFFIM
jgi:hypothetical protein